MQLYLVHCWDAFTTQNGIEDWHPLWYDWLEFQFPKGTVKVLRMPNSNSPQIEAWVSALIDAAPIVDEQTVFVGHSVGCQAILRYLSLQKATTVGAVILIAGWFKLTNLESQDAERIAQPWVDTSIEFASLASLRKKTSVILSDDDPFVPLDTNVNVFKKYITEDITILQGKGHFDNCSSIPLLKEKLQHSGFSASAGGENPFADKNAKSENE